MKYLAFLIIFLPALACASVVNQTNESPSGWSFNYSSIAGAKQKTMFNVFVPKCQKDHENESCAEDQRQARAIANKQAVQNNKKAIAKKKARVQKAPEKETSEDRP